MQTMGDVLNTARMFLNDQNIQLWTDAVLTPMFQRAFLELEVILRQRAAPIMKNHVIVTLPPGTLAFPSEPDLISPIQLLEGVPGSQGTLMTESDPLPRQAQRPTLDWWNWDGTVISFIGATSSREVQAYYWRSLPTPGSSGAPIIIIDGEMWLAPRVAAIAAASVGEEVTSAAAADNAERMMEKVILANRGRAAQLAGASIRP